jgi:pimeloyl-ACP methyl ester carboxylesterase
MPTVLSEGVPIYYEVIGTGTPILLVHGWLGSFASHWKQTGWIDFLLAQGRQVVGIDCRGHGHSGKPHDPSVYDGDRFADDVIAVLDEVGLERTDLMGYSMGGQIVINLLARRPERFTSVIAGGAGLRSASALGDQTANIEALETDNVSSITNPRALDWRRRAEGGLAYPASLAARDNDLKAFAAMLRNSDPVQVASKPAKHTDALRRAQTPVLAVVGENDPSLSEARLLIDTVRFGELVVLPGENHASAISSKKYKEAVASFLTAHAFTAA